VIRSQRQAHVLVWKFMAAVLPLAVVAILALNGHRAVERDPVRLDPTSGPAESP
jgi:hypothetical protein